MKIESYWFGFVVVNEKQQATSKAFATEPEAQAFIETINKIGLLPFVLGGS